MTRRGASDPSEVHQDMPLFAPRLREMSHAADPHTSMRAAAKAVSTGQVAGDRAWALSLVRGRPGSTCPELAKYATYDADESVRQRIGRRLPELMRAGLIYRNGERDGCALWWPGRNRDRVRRPAVSDKRKRGVLSERERISLCDHPSEKVPCNVTLRIERAVLLAAARRLSQLFFKDSQADVRVRFAGRILRSWAKELRDER